MSVSDPEDENVERFRKNPIVRRLLDFATEHGYGLNDIWQEFGEIHGDTYIGNLKELYRLIGY